MSCSRCWWLQWCSGCSTSRAQVFNVSFYTEQLLTVCLGLTLALAYIADTSRRRHWSDWVAVVVSLGLCGYIAARYEALTYELGMMPLRV